MIFRKNKYTRWYSVVINRALERGWRKKTAPCYVEAHHALPRSIAKEMGLRLGRKGGVVYLTAREHFICHRLLAKMCVEPSHTRKMVFALHRLMHGNDKVYCHSASTYAEVQALHSIAASQRSKDHWASIPSEVRSVMRSGPNHPSYGMSRSLEWRANIGAGNKGKLAGSKHPLWGVGHSDEAKQKMRNNARRPSVGKKWYNNGQVEKYYIAGTQPSDFVLGRLT